MATAKFSLFKKRKRRPSRSAETWPVTPTTTISGRTSLKKKKKKRGHARIQATNSAFYPNARSRVRGCVLSGSGGGELALEKGKQTVQGEEEEED